MGVCQTYGDLLYEMFPLPNNERAKKGLIALSLLFPLFGLILGGVYLKRKPRAAKTYLNCGFFVWGFGFMIVLLTAAQA